MNDHDGYSIRSITVSDVPALVSIHEAAFPDFFLTSMGPKFLGLLYEAYCYDPSSVTVLLSTEQGKVVGFVVGTTEPSKFYRRLLLRRGLSFAIASTSAVLRRPSLSARLFGGLKYRGDSPSELSGAALLASIAVDPSYEGSGVGRRMLETWSKQIADQGVSSAYLTTDRLENDRVNGFYRRAGWRLLDSFTTSSGRQMNRYIKRVGQEGAVQ